MAVYATILINISDPSTYELYTAGWLDVWQKHSHGGEVLAVDDDPILIEGEWPSRRTVIMRFPSEAAFHAWYRSAEYQQLVKHRRAASSASLALIREFTMPVGNTAKDDETAKRSVVKP